MPNQRAKNKVLVGAFVDTQLKLRVRRHAKSKGITTSDVVAAALQQYLAGEPPEPAFTPPSPTTGSLPAAEAQSAAAQNLNENEVWLL